ncbi:MAG TPA: RNHCP domain-containing protein [Patescibacteria group bacterium]|nr:RNHCP domain-containing protein [Patescibacteria group bacterium]
MKIFSRRVEDFVCANCGFKVSGNGYTNHCPRCLYSKHVDINPGDRAHFCGGLMEPVGYDAKKGILHRCVVCKFERYNKLQENDNSDKIIELSALV